MAVSKLNPDEIEGDDLSGGYILKHDKFTGSATVDFFSSKYPPLSNQPDKKPVYLFEYPKVEDLAAEQRAYIVQFIIDTFNPGRNQNRYFGADDNVSTQ